MLLVPAFPIAITQIKEPTPTAIPRMVSTLRIQLRFKAVNASRRIVLKFIRAFAYLVSPGELDSLFRPGLLAFSRDMGSNNSSARRLRTGERGIKGFLHSQPVSHSAPGFLQSRP